MTRYYAEHRTTDPDGIERLEFKSTKSLDEAKEWIAKCRDGVVIIMDMSGKKLREVYRAKAKSAAGFKA